MNKYSLFLFIPENLSQPKIPKITRMGFSEESNYNITEATRQLQFKRLHHLQHACSDKDLFKHAIYKKKSNIVLHYSSRYNVTFCNVPKAGCSFLTQVFGILRYGANASDEVFGMKRMDVHANVKLARANHLNASRATRRHSRSILVSRDPYSRLYSAFIDKIFLPLMYYESVNIVQKLRKVNQTNLVCAIDVTFEEFLTYIIDEARTGRYLNSHWTPIFSLCKPCDTRAFSLVKQETFAADVEYVLKEVGIADDEFNVIYDALHDHRIDTTIPSLVATVTTMTEKAKTVQQCINRNELARRIWTSFQIQGYIKDDIPFPTKTIDTNEKANSSEFLTQVILDTIKKHPMSPTEAKLQRRRALVKAYDGLSKEILDKVKILYKQDFILFDYSFEPPRTIEH